MAAACTPARAMERIQLTTGFPIDCARHETIGAMVRIYFDKSGTNFQDFPAGVIGPVEVLPDPPPPAPGAAINPAPILVADVPTLIARVGAQHNIDVDLLASVIKAESGGRTNAVSRAGARGLMQLMPGTARQLGVDDAFRPDQNISGGTTYLDSLLVRYHDNLGLALAAYNAGPAAVDRYHGIPPYRETRAYVDRIERDFIRRKNALKKAVSQQKDPPQRKAATASAAFGPVPSVIASR